MIWDGSFPYQGIEQPCEWHAVTLADCQHSRNDPRRISPQKIMLRFWAIITSTIFRNRGNVPSGSTPPNVLRLSSRRRSTGVLKAKELHLHWGQQDKCVTICSRHCFSMTEKQSFLWQAIGEQQFPGARSIVLFYSTKLTAYWDSNTHITKLAVLQHRSSSITLERNSASTSNHKSTPTICTACPIPGTTISLHSWHQSRLLVPVRVPGVCFDASDRWLLRVPGVCFDTSDRRLRSLRSLASNHCLSTDLQLKQW